ncbi:MAG: hypothetical protein H6623_08245 [Bdellovibrionaceae bacterium]|nr:hypothetical protein [Pseudobdellovibrionaceae bacterium]
MKKILFIGLLSIFYSAAYSASNDSSTACINTCKAANGTEFCVSNMSFQSEATITEVTVFYTTPNGDHIITNVYPYATLEDMKSEVVEASKHYGQGYQASVQNLVDSIMCTNQSQDLVLSDGPDMQAAF